MSALVGTLFLASLAVVHSYKSFCLEIPCDATTYGSIQNVFVYDQVAIKNLDKVPHHIVCSKFVVFFRLKICLCNFSFRC